MSTRSRPSCGGVRLLFMQSNGGLTDARRFQGKDAILSGPGRRHRRRGAHLGCGRLRPDHRLRHGRHLDRRVALRRRVRARVRDPGRRRAHARADDEHPHRRRRRRLDPAFRRRALPRRPGLRRRQSRPGLLPPRRPAHRHRRQRDARQDPAGVLPAGVRRRRATSRWTRRWCERKFAELDAEESRDGRSRRSRWPKASCRSRSATWPTRSSRSRCSAATT